MKKAGIIRGGICLALFCLMALHCANPFLPVLIITPEDGTVFIADAVTSPYPVAVEVSVPLPACGATSFPVNPATFSASLQKLVDGELESELPLDLGDPVEDPGTGTLMWSGTINLTAFGDYSVVATISNDQGPATRARDFRLEQTVSELQGQVPQVTISGLAQNPANCLFPNILLGVINGLIGDLYFYMVIPSGADIDAATPPGYPVTINLPVLGGVDVVLTLDEPNNDILMDGPDDYTINLTGLAPIPGFDCIITGAADGAWNDTDPGDLDGSLIVSITDVQADPVGGGCSLSAPTGACNLIVGLDADP